MNIFLVGGSSDLGRSIKEVAIQRGHKVLSTFNSSGEEFNDLQLDVRDEAAVATCVARANEALEGMEAVVYCSAVDSPSLISQANISHWQDLFDVNFFGAVRVAKYVAPLFVSRRSGVFELISSGMASRSNVGATAYAASKASLNSLAKGLSREYGQFGVRAFTVMPGFFNGGLIRNVSVKDRARIATLLDSRRIAETLEIAQFCISVLENSSYITSSNLEIHGGMA